MNLYGLKNCDTCRKAKKALDGAHVRYAFHDVREEPPTKMQIGRWAKAAGWEKLLNKSSTTWRGLSDAEKDGVTEKKALALMAAHPTLIKRPVIENGPTQVFVGWSKEVQDKVLD
ncbi:Spx/MgsR family RNA polymerase-binding regulatory protein [Hyphococcus sp.]|uniref:Spx/MgsR family RNA polymerase-binding regulatory protein n=1 Tax=Hyphococcus sp. TaxID=2038636 RepID=UPI0035C6E9C4